MMTRYRGMDEPQPIDLEAIKGIADANKTLGTWASKLEKDLAEAIGAKKATVKFTEDKKHPHLEVTIPGRQYTRIMYDPGDHPNQPFIVYPLNSKDELYTEDAEKLWCATFTKEALEKIVADIDYFYGPPHSTEES